MISVSRVFYTSNNLHQLFIIITFIHNLQNRKPCIDMYVYTLWLKFSQLMYLKVSARLHMLMTFNQTPYADDDMPNKMVDCVKKNLFRK